jgi:hypothetical protein
MYEMNVRQSMLPDYDFYKNVSHAWKHKFVIGWLLRTIAILYNSSNQFFFIITAPFVVTIKLTNNE